MRELDTRRKRPANVNHVATDVHKYKECGSYVKKMNKLCNEQKNPTKLFNPHTQRICNKEMILVNKYTPSIKGT